MNAHLRRAITQLRDIRDSASMESSAVGEIASYVNLSFESRTLQIRSDQVNVNNIIARTFRLIPETIILVSDSGTVAICSKQNLSRLLPSLC